MKTSTASVVAVLIVAMLASGACRGRESAAGGETTETIAPASPQPQPTGTDAMTQTVDVEAGRSEAEGGLLTGTGPATDTAATDTTGTTQTAPPPSTTT